MIVGILLSYIVWWFRHRCSLRMKNVEPQVIEIDTRNKTKSNPEAGTIDSDSTYQELDLTKMNKDDNYQSLMMKGNTSSNNAGNDDETTYTELNKVRDMENNYESLT